MRGSLNYIALNADGSHSIIDSPNPIYQEFV